MFEIKNETEHQGQSSPKSTGTLTVLRCIFGPNLEIPTSIGGDFSHGQAQNGVNFDFWVRFDLEVQGQSSHKIIGILTKVFSISGSNLVILAWTVDELLHGQADDWRTDTRTHTHTHAGNDNTRRPKLASGKNGGIQVSSEPTIHCNWGNPNLYLDQLITKGCCQPFRGHALNPTDSRDATRLRLFSSLWVTGYRSQAGRPIKQAPDLHSNLIETSTD